MDGSVSSKRTGSGDGAMLETVTVTGAEVNSAPSTFRATAVSVCEPLLAVVVSQEIEYGAEVSRAPRLAPSSRNCTLETVREPMMVTFALTVAVSLTMESGAGDVMATIRLPPGSGSGGSNCAKAWGAIQIRLKIPKPTAPQARLTMFSMGCPSA